jgi:predicted GNAT family acetyltransferase
MTLRDAADRRRFELEEAGLVVFADYRRADGVLEILHVEAPPALRGGGAAGRLMAGVLEEARRRKERVRPICAYAAAYMRRRPETHDLLA